MFVLTSRIARPVTLIGRVSDIAVDGGAKHTSAEELCHVARCTVALNLQRRYRRTADRDEKCAPSTVTGVPPSTDPASGEIERTRCRAWNSNSWPLRTSPPRRGLRPKATLPGGARGVRHCMRAADTQRAGVDAAPAKLQTSNPEVNCSPVNVSSVPPLSGPMSGCTLRITGPRYAKTALPSVKSSPFIEISSGTTPTACGGDVHSTRSAETRRARASDWSKRQYASPSAAARAGRRLTTKLTSVPPPAGPWCGTTTRTSISATYSKCSWLDVKSCPFAVTSRVAFPDGCGRAVHSSRTLEIHRAATGAPSPNRHIRPGPATKCSPATRTIVPPRTGPAFG